VNKEAAIVVIDGSTGHSALGPGPSNRKHPSTAVSMYLLGKCFASFSLIFYLDHFLLQLM
jgi:hypothetical protein